MSESAWSQRNSSDSLDSTGDSGDDVDAENDDDDEELDLSGDTPFGSLEVSRLLEDLSETAAQMVKEDLATKVSSSSSGVESEEEGSCSASSKTASDTQCDAAAVETEMEVASAFLRVEPAEVVDKEKEKDELENVNVREMRKIFLLPSTPKSVGSANDSSQFELSKSRSCACLAMAAAVRWVVKTNTFFTRFSPTSLFALQEEGGDLAGGDEEPGAAESPQQPEADLLFAGPEQVALSPEQEGSGGRRRGVAGPGPGAQVRQDF